MIIVETMSGTESDLCYKSCGEYIVTMKKLSDTICNESRKGIIDQLHAKFRTDKLLVISIEHKETKETLDKVQNTSYLDKKIWYKVSKEVSVTDYDRDVEVIYGKGIHYFLSRETAFYWDNFNIKDGIFKSWYDNGQNTTEYTNVDGKRHGTCRTWNYNGQKITECNYVNGKLNGLWLSWNNEGTLTNEGYYVNGKRDGLWQTWYSNGQKKMKCIYASGYYDGLWKLWYNNGQKNVECIYVVGKKHGPYKRWFYDGKKQIECTYLNDELDQ